MTGAARHDRLVHTAVLMGTVASMHVHTGPGADAAAIQPVLAGAQRRLEELEELFSPFRPDSAVSRVRRGELALSDADPLLREVAEDCEAYHRQTEGRFSPWWDGAWDPTGYVKGWAGERVVRDLLEPLLARRGVRAVGLNLGGDIAVRTHPDADHEWTIGIADPTRPGTVRATLRLREGAIATSGTAERGSHLRDPRTGEAIGGAVSATVVSADLGHADVWATAAAVAGAEDLSWISSAGTVSGLVVGADGRVRRWAGPAEITPAMTAAA